MAEFDSCLSVDKAAYSSVLLALHSLELKIFNSIKTWEQVSREQHIKLGAEFPKQESHFMGIVKPKNLSTNKTSLTLELEELSGNGRLTGESFLLTLNSEISSQWISHPTMKLVNPAENFLLILQNVPGCVKMSKDIHFSVGSTDVNARILVKHYFSPCADTSSFRNENLLTLTEAIATRPPSFDVFAVVRYVVKIPESTRLPSRTAHGMFAMIDPSCEPDRCTTGYIAQIFANSLNVFPVIEAGDIVKFERISTQTSLNNKDVIELVVKHGQTFIVFPNGVNWEKPTSPADYFKITEKDFDDVNNLKKWYREQTVNKSTSIQSEDEQQGTSFNEKLDNLKGVYADLDPNHKKRISLSIDRVLQQAVFDSPSEADDSSFSEDNTRQKRRSFDLLGSRPPKRGRTEPMSSSQAQEDSGLQLFNESLNNSRYFSDIESSSHDINVFDSFVSNCPSKLVSSSPK